MPFEPTLSDLANLLIRTTTERTIADCQKKHDETLAKVEKKALDLQIENQMLRNDNINLKAERGNLQGKNLQLADENHKLKAMLQSQPATCKDLAMLGGTLRTDMTTIKGGLKEIRQKMDRMH